MRDERVVLARASVQLGVLLDLVDVAAGVGVEEGLLETEDDDTGRRSVNLDLGVANAVGQEGNVDVAVGDGAVGLGLSLVGLGVNTNAAEELSTRLGDAIEEKSGRGADRGLEEGEVSAELEVERRDEEERT